MHTHSPPAYHRTLATPYFRQIRSTLAHRVTDDHRGLPSRPNQGGYARGSRAGIPRCSVTLVPGGVSGSPSPLTGSGLGRRVRGRADPHRPWPARSRVRYRSTGGRGGRAMRAICRYGIDGCVASRSSGSALTASPISSSRMRTASKISASDRSPRCRWERIASIAPGYRPAAGVPGNS